MFPTYLELGFDHILDLQGYDHILFLIALCAAYAATEWKRILILVTAFTIGHSVTLALSSLKVINVNADLVEWLIPITILITALIHLFRKPDTKTNRLADYSLALFFGFIHGMGFSNYFRALLGQEAEIIVPLFAFNLGVELGQLVIVTVIMVLNYLFVGIGKLSQNYWRKAVCLIAALLSIYIIIGKL